MCGLHTGSRPLASHLFCSCSCPLRLPTWTLAYQHLLRIRYERRSRFRTLGIRPFKAEDFAGPLVRRLLIPPFRNALHASKRRQPICHFASDLWPFATNGATTRNKKLLGAPGLTTRSKDTSRGSWHDVFGAPILLPIFGRYHSTQRRFSRRLGSQAWTQPLSLQSGQMGRDSINQPSSLGNPLPPLQLLAKILEGISTVCHNLKQHWKHLQRPSADGRSACCR